MQIIRNTISVPTKHIKILLVDFECSKMTVYNALNDVSQSEKAKEIRKRAKELLIEEVENIEI